MLTDHQFEKAKASLKFIKNNFYGSNRRRIKKITLSFEHPRFKDNTGFAIISDDQILLNEITHLIINHLETKIDEHGATA